MKFLILIVTLFASSMVWADEGCFYALTQYERAASSETVAARHQAIQRCDTPQHRGIASLQMNLRQCNQLMASENRSEAIEQCEINAYLINQRSEYPGPVPEDVYRSKPWKIDGILCPIGCTEHTKKFVLDRKGQFVKFGPDNLQNPLYTSCPTPAIFHLSRTSLSSYLLRVHSESSPDAKFTPSSLGLTDKNVWAGYFSCADKVLGQNTVGRIIFLDSQHGLLVFEDDSFIQLSAT